MMINCRMGDCGLSPVGAKVTETVAGSMEKRCRNRDVHHLLGIQWPQS